jgi:hypothetical protein
MTNRILRLFRSRALGAAALAAAALALAPAGAAAADPPVRLLHGPQVFRIKRVAESSRAPDYRYAIVAQFSRVVFGSTFDGEGKTTGDYTISGVSFPDFSQGTLDLKRRSGECLTAYLEGTDTSARDLRKLGRIQLGAKTKVTLRPLRTATPNLKYERTSTRHPVMRSASSWNFKSAADQRQLRRIGCGK